MHDTLALVFPRARRASVEKLSEIATKKVVAWLGEPLFADHTKEEDRLDNEKGRPEQQAPKD